jgi:DNA-directed RNA polymerase subunit beta
VIADPRPRRRRRKITLPLALVLIVIALVAGILVGYSARGDSPPGGMLTEDRSVPVVTVTVPAEP